MNGLWKCRFNSKQHDQFQQDAHYMGYLVQEASLVIMTRTINAKHYMMTEYLIYFLAHIKGQSWFLRLMTLIKSNTDLLWHCTESLAVAITPMMCVPGELCSKWLSSLWEHLTDCSCEPYEHLRRLSHDNTNVLVLLWWNSKPSSAVHQ